MRRRVRDRAHRASRSAAQRERVLGFRRGRLASETPDQRTSRLELGRALAQIETTSKKGRLRTPRQILIPHLYVLSKYQL